jgi:hypothetical protein
VTFFSLKRGALALGGAALLLGATVGFSAAQAGHPPIAKLARHELSVAATTLGYPNVKALRRDLAGTTLTALAQEHNVAPATVDAAIKADVDAKIQALVAAGTIKPNRAATLKVKAEAKVDKLMTRQFKNSSLGREAELA